MDEPRFILGIDLGTTHSVVAYTEAGTSDGESPQIHLFGIPQVVSPGEIDQQPLLPSFLFLPGPHDVPEGGIALPWNRDIDYVVGEYARSRGSELPARLVASAKSWLSNSGVDRAAPILPWDAPPDTRRISPVETTSRFLQHIRDAWNHRMAADNPDFEFERQEILLTVPASFDAVARELTVQAARSAGLEHFTLLEEPQAAFYAWIHARGDQWRNLINVGESILVCDVGGGTTDFSLIQVKEDDGNLELQRIAVGNHILLGGDNMDLTLAYSVRAKLAQQGTNLDNWQFRSLWYSCRRAKERLLGDPDKQAEPIVILGQGTSLIGGTIRTELTRQEIESVLLQGFFPITSATDYPEQKPRLGVREMGLPYASDPAITRHLAYFLGRQTTHNNVDGAVAYPSAVLFNGGVMKAEVLRTRILEILSSWSANEQIRELPSIDLDLAVAVGAAYYGLARKGRGIRIRAGAPRSYYIGIESSMPSVPGIPTPIKALCVVPFGMEEGTEAQVREREFGLVVGENAVFPLLAANNRREDKIGEVVEDWSGDIQEITTMETHLPATDTEEDVNVIPVYLESHMTEIGTLELWCVARDSDRKWKLEFNIREQQQV